METKFCSKCNTIKPIEDFFSNGLYKGKKKYKPYCGKCEAALQKQHYIETIKKAYEITHNKPFECSVCGYKKNFSSLEFHHINPEEKEFGIATRKTISLSLAVKEISKCILLCANCHSELHNPLYSMVEDIGFEPI